MVGGLALILMLVVAPVAQAAPPSVRADFSKPREVADLVGFTRGMDLGTPPDHRIVPLQPNLWRGKFRDLPYKRALRLGGRYSFVLSDRYGYASRPPYEDFRRWRRVVRNAARQNRERQIVWDVWNEPDLAYFWKGTKEQFFETYRVAYEELRRELGPGITVSGPSTTSYREDWIRGLLDYCAAHGCEVNALSWHELSTGSIPGVGERVRKARSRHVDPAHRRAQGVRELHVSEVVGERDQYLPAENLGYLHSLESGGADAAARACWPAENGDSNCYNESLAGLLQPGSFEPRSVWWLTRAYSEGADSRVLTRNSDSHIVGAASSASGKARSAQLLIGNIKRRTGRTRSRSRTDVRVTLRKLSRLTFLRGARRVRVSIEKFPATDEAPLPTPHRRRTSRTPIRRGEAEFKLHGVRPHEAYRLTFTRG